MKNYLKLELRKLNLKRQLKGILIVLLCLLLYETIGIMNGGGGTKDTYDPYLPKMMNLLTTTAFLIFSSVLTVNLIIGEYTNRTILILFSYPLDRRKIISIKLGIVVFFTMACILLGNLCCNLYTGALDALFDVVEGGVTRAYLLQILGQTAFGMLMGGILSTLPFVFGMRKKSVPATFISSVAVAGIFMEAMGISPSPLFTLAFCAALAVICLAAVHNTLKYRIGRLDDGV